MFGFDKMFDFNRDGKLDSWERAAQFQFMDEMMKDDDEKKHSVLVSQAEIFGFEGVAYRRQYRMITIVMFNPVIVSKRDMYETEEDCLSLDGVRKTTRYQEIEVE